MKTIKSLEELNVPTKHKQFLRTFLKNAREDIRIQQIVLFGSCAREEPTQSSDIDVAVLGENLDDYDYVRIYNYFPEYDSDIYVEFDLITMTYDVYNKFIDTIGYIQRHINKEGVDLSELIR